MTNFTFKDLSVLVLCLLLLTACGGGGGGGGGSDAGSQNPDPGFSLLRNSIDFTVTTDSGTQSGIVEFYDVSYLDAKTVVVTTPADSAGWLVAARVGLVNPGSPSPRIGVEVIVDPSYKNLGNYKTKITVAVEGRGSRDIDVSMLVIRPIRLDQTRFQTDLIYGAAALSQWTVDHTLTAGASTHWKASSSKSWVNVTPSAGSGGATLRSAVDISGLGVGTHVATIKVQDDDYPFVNSASVDHVINVTAPELSVPGEVTINGPVGIGEEREKSLQFSINTGSVRYPYTLSFTNAGNEDWLEITPTAGTVGETGQTIQLTAASNLDPGIYSGTLTLSVDVNGYLLTKPIPVTFYKEVNRVVVQSNGVSFLKAPSRSVLTKDVKVLSSLGRNNTPWQAIPDQTWLSATPAGVTGDSLTLTANTAGLTPGAYYSATVEISSSDPGVTNAETIQVGLQYLSSDPANISVNIPEVGPAVSLTPYMVTSPVEPLAFVAVRNQILAYSVHTGVLVRSFALPWIGIKGMTISSDGLYLYVFGIGSPNRVILEVNARTGAVLYSFDSSLPYDNLPDLTPGYVRPAGIPHLVNIGTTGINLATRFAVRYDGHAASLREYSVHASTIDPSNPMRAIQPNGLVLDLVPSSLFPYTLWGSAANTPYPYPSHIGACVNDPATKVFTGNWPDNVFVAVVDFPVAGAVQSLPSGGILNSIACWSGQRVLATMLPTSTSSEDTIIFDADSSAVLFHQRLAPVGDNSIRPNGIAFSSDGTRIVAITDNGDGYDKLIIVNAP